MDVKYFFSCNVAKVHDNKAYFLPHLNSAPSPSRNKTDQKCFLEYIEYQLVYFPVDTFLNNVNIFVFFVLGEMARPD